MARRLVDVIYVRLHANDSWCAAPKCSCSHPRKHPATHLNFENVPCASDRAGGGRWGPAELQRTRAAIHGWKALHTEQA
eukprot:863492-Prymnesium_polylepis.1